MNITQARRKSDWLTRLYGRPYAVVCLYYGYDAEVDTGLIPNAERIADVPGHEVRGEEREQ